jgi:hypothetical protein
VRVWLLPYSNKFCAAYDTDVAALSNHEMEILHAAFRVREEFHPLGKKPLKEIEGRAMQAIEGKGRYWWNPDKSEGKKRGKFGIQIVE